MEDALSQELINEINSAEPCLIIKDTDALAMFERVHEAIVTLGLNDFHDRICRWCAGAPRVATEPALEDAENLMIMVKSWLRYKGIPFVYFWYPSKVIGHWVRACIYAAPNVDPS